MVGVISKCAEPIWMSGKVEGCGMGPALPSLGLLVVGIVELSHRVKEKNRNDVMVHHSICMVGVNSNVRPPIG
ncbi:hypothetical protein HNY73_012352 [Argiope bruennichi]|uniref:Uncharacterized protein n=1 Tax=Argiope bruennichi TaxID=94029 RepID=A0A8T0EWQ6_ARGBR|nr:hypothetical protein HNY73_012352 [Argiope bruennichi]